MPQSTELSQGPQLGLSGHPQMALGPAAPAGEEQAGLVAEKLPDVFCGSVQIIFGPSREISGPKDALSLHPVWLQDVAGCLLALAEGPWDVTVTPQQSLAQGQQGQHDHKATTIPEIQTEGGCTCLTSESRMQATQRKAKEQC